MLQVVGVILALIILAAPFAAEAQQPGRVWRIGVLAVPADTDAKQVFQTFEQGLRELGYVDKRNIIIEYRLALNGFRPSLPSWSGSRRT